MFYVYLIRRKNNQLYIGYSGDLRRRIEEHKRGDRSVKLLYYEAYSSDTDARLREHRLKDFGKAYGQLKRRIANSLG